MKIVAIILLLAGVRYGATDDFGRRSVTERISNEKAVVQAYQLVYQREPSQQEQAAAMKLITTHGLKSFCRAILNSNELLYLD